MLSRAQSRGGEIQVRWTESGDGESGGGEFRFPEGQMPKSPLGRSDSAGGPKSPRALPTLPSRININVQVLVFWRSHCNPHLACHAVVV